MKTVVLALLGMLALLGCQQRPLTPQETLDQQRFFTDCRHSDAAHDPTEFEGYCDRF